MNHNTEDITAICEIWSNAAGVSICERLDELILELASEVMRSKFEDQCKQQLLCRVLSVRLTKYCVNDKVRISAVCQSLISELVHSVLDLSSKGRHNESLTTLELSLECLLLCGVDKFCLEFVENITEKIITHKESTQKTEVLISIVECMLNACISVKLMDKSIVKMDLRTFRFLESERFHTMISDVLLTNDNESLRSFVVLNVVPKLVNATKTYTVVNNLWVDVSSGSHTLLYKLSMLCGLSKFLISKDNCTLLVIKLNEFWMIIQESLISDDAMERKKGLYLLKRSVDIAATLNLQVSVDLFYWSYLTSNCLQRSWEKFFILYEILEEKQSHLVIPLINSTFNDPDPFGCLEKSWNLVIYKRLLSHDSVQVTKQGILTFLKLNVSSYMKSQFLLEAVLNVLFYKLNNMLLFSCNSSKVEWSVVDTALNLWFSEVILSSEDFSKFFSLILRAMVSVQWCTTPLFHVLYSMSLIPDIKVIDEEKLDKICTFLKDVVRTQNIFIRGAVQCAFLKMITKRSSNCLSTMSVANTVGVFRSNECLCRGLESWDLLKEWVGDCLRKKSSKENSALGELLDMSLHLPLEFRARTIILLVDSGICSIDGYAKDLLKKYFSVLVGTAERVYASREESDTCVKVILHIVEDSKICSKSICVVNDPLILAMKPYIKEVTPYVRKRLFEVELENFESVELYVQAINVLSDQDLVTLSESSNIFKAAKEVFFYPGSPLIQKYFSLKIFNFFMKFITGLTLSRTDYYVDNEKQSINQFCLAIIKNDGLIKTDLPKDVLGKVRTRNHQVNWGLLVSKYNEALWLVLKESIDSGCVSVSDILKILPIEEVVKAAITAIESGGRDAFVPIVGVVKLTLSHAIKNSTLFETFLHLSWSSCFDQRKAASFWSTIRAWIEMTFRKNVILEKELHLLLVSFSAQILAQGETVSGLNNILMVHLHNELTEVESIEPMLDILTSAALFGPVPRKDQKIENDTCALIRSLGPSYSVNILIPESWSHSSQEVRACALAILLRGGEKVFLTEVKRLLAVDSQLTAKRQRYHGDSSHHRTKHRILQALLLIEGALANSSSLTAKSCIVDLVKWASSSLQGESQQPSVRYQLEWLLVRSLLHSPHNVSDFWTIFGQASEERTGSVCSFISVAYHLALCLGDKTFTDRCVTEILPWCMAQQYNVRLYAQVVLQKIWSLDSSVAKKYEAIQKSLTKSLSQGNAVRNAEKLQSDFYFTVFHPINHFSLETVFYELPRLSNISRDELVPMSILQERFTDLTLIPLANPDKALTSCSVAPWVVKATEEADPEIEASALQKKFVPWKSMFPELEARSETSTSTQLVVVASLIDKLPNLGGLARTCEIFTAQCLAIANLQDTKNKEFSTLSMSAEKHVNIIEVKLHDLPQYLQTMKNSGYLVVGAEQTASSVSLHTFRFPRKCVLLLGNEKEGVPVNLLPLLDVCVEIRQMGVVRSLNVHVTGALFVWEYTKQFLASNVAKDI